MFTFSFIKIFPCFFSISACFLLSITYVASLYVWKSPHNRNHPSTIKRRFCSVFIMMLISPLLMKQFVTNEKFKSVSLFELMGFRFPGLFYASTLPLLLTMILFLGPLCLQGLLGSLHLFSEPVFWVTKCCNLIWIRNHIVAPLSEEFTFRACMMPLLLQCFKPLNAVFICPLFFGLAHVHHMVERRKSGLPFNQVVVISCFEFCYTTLFGAYSGLLFVKTGHFIAPFLAHAFCNLMGFPDFDEVLSHKNPKKLLLVILYISGVFLWLYLFVPLTDHTLYDNDLFWNINL